MNYSMQAEVVDNYADFLNLKEDWYAAYERDPDAGLFVSWDWLAQIFESREKNWCVLTVRLASAGNKRERGRGCGCGRCVAFLPLRIGTRVNKSGSAICNELTMAGSYFWADYTGFVCDPEFDQTALPLLAENLKSLRWNRVFLKYFYASDRRLSLFLGNFRNKRFFIDQRTSTSDKGRINKLICPVVDLPECFDQFLSQQLSANTRQKVRRFLRKVEASDEYRFATTTKESLDDHLDAFVDLWIKKWRPEKGKEVVRLAARYEDILRTGFEHDLLYMPVLWCGDEPLGVLGTFIDRQKMGLSFYVAGRKQDAGNFPIGLLLHAYSIRWAIEHSFRRYDFLRGDEAYKYSFGCSENHLKFLVIGTKSGENLHKKLSPDSLPDALDLAIKLEKRGNRRLAAIGYQQILDVQANHAVANQRMEAVQRRD